MSTLTDDALKKVFIEVQTKITEHSRQLAGVKAQIQAKERDRRLAELTAKELTGLEDGVKTYKSCGKMFIQQDKDALKSELGTRISKDQEDVRVLEKTMGYLERNITDSQNSLKEILQRR